MRIVVLIARILLGLTFVVFGANGLHPFPTMPPPPGGLVGQYTHSGFTNRCPLSPPAAPAAPPFVLSRVTESSFLHPAGCLNDVFPAGYGTRKFRGERVDSSPPRSTYKWSRTTRPADCSAETTPGPGRLVR